MVDKTKFKDEKGRYIVQGLFLEDRYNTKLSVFTLDGEDKEYKGKVYPSLKQLYLEHSDPLEYDFATTHLYDWDHWQRLCSNAVVSRHIEKWREELRLKLMSDGVQVLIQMAEEGKQYQAAKYLAELGWDKKDQGRPSKEAVEGELKKRADIQKDYENDLAILENYRKK